MANKKNNDNEFIKVNKYIGKGLLVGYTTRKVFKNLKHIYYVVYGLENHQKQMFSSCQLIEIMEDSQVLEELKMQKVKFDIYKKLVNDKWLYMFKNIKKYKDITNIPGVKNND